MQVEGIAQRPTMLEAVEPAGRVQRALRTTVAKCWDRLPHRGPGRLATAPHQARAAWAQHPLVRTRHEEIAAQIGDIEILDAKPVYAVHAQQDPIAGATHHVRDGANGQLYSRAGVHPRESQHASVWSKCLSYRLHDLVHAGR